MANSPQMPSFSDFRARAENIDKPTTVLINGFDKLKKSFEANEAKKKAELTRVHQNQFRKLFDEMRGQNEISKSSASTGFEKQNNGRSKIADA